MAHRYGRQIFVARRYAFKNTVSQFFAVMQGVVHRKSTQHPVLHIVRLNVLPVDNVVWYSSCRLHSMSMSKIRFNIIDIVFESAFGNGVASDIGRAVAPWLPSVRRKSSRAWCCSTVGPESNHTLLFVSTCSCLRVFLLAWRPSAGLRQILVSIVGAKVGSPLQKSPPRKKHCQNIVSFFFHLWPFT